MNAEKQRILVINIRIPCPTGRSQLCRSGIRMGEVVSEP